MIGEAGCNALNGPTKGEAEISKASEGNFDH